MRSRLPTLLAPILAVLAIPTSISAQETGHHAQRPALTKRTKAVTPAQKIAEAMTAAPEEITRTATIMDWPATPTGEFTVLRQGGSEWICLPSPPTSLGFDPMCVDDVWMGFVRAVLRQEPPPKPTKVGYSYMLSAEGEGSNTDLTATAPTADNQWHRYGPHIMLIYPDPKMYDALSDDPHNGGAYVMYKGTPLAHVMMPVASVPKP